jgi:hypothetical protein
VKPWPSGREGVGVARGPSHRRARVVEGRRVRAARDGRMRDCNIVVVVVLVIAVVEFQWSEKAKPRG